MPNLTNSDALSMESRAFFERTKMKLAVSFLLSIFAWIFIGWTAEAGKYTQIDVLLIV